MPELGHVVFYVEKLQPMVRFYRDIVGLTLTGTTFGGKAAVLTGGRTHHELLLIEVGPAPAAPEGRRIGLYHVGWKVGDTREALRAAQARIEAAGLALEGTADHHVSLSLYLRDPDGNEIELYVDNPEVDWNADPSWLSEPVRPLRL